MKNLEKGKERYGLDPWTAVSLLLSFALLAGSVFPAEAAEAPAYSQYLSGEKAEEHSRSEDAYTQIVISTEEELAELAGNCRLDAWSRDKYVLLGNDISLQEHRDISIPVFGGIFDGGGFCISNLELEASGSATGLFRYIQEGGQVRNLTVSGWVRLGGSGSEAGILAGVNYGRITDCAVSGSVMGTSRTGGLVGVNEKTGQIRRCQSSAIVTGDHYTGGICGQNSGVLNNCTNMGNVNTYSLEVTYDLEDITMENLEDRSRAENIAAHTDTGGIAGYSDGKIYYCSNSGTVGYQHVGYNVGGIVGRMHQGYLQNCTNTGHILGRKDVGGLAGQMEPFLEIQYLNDKLSQIDREVGVFLDLLQKTNKDLGGFGTEAAGVGRNIGVSLQNASAAAGSLMDAASDLWYIYNLELTGISNDSSRLNQEWKDLAAADREKAEKKVEEEQKRLPDFTVSGNEWPTVSGGDGWLPDFPDGSDTDGDVLPDVESYLAALRRFGDSTNRRLNTLNAVTKDRTGGIDADLEVLDREMQAASNGFVQLMDVLDEGIGETNADMDALIEQARVLYNLFAEIRDELFRYEGISVEDASDEAAGGDMNRLGADAYQEDVYYDTKTFQKGKITLCLNQGLVEADTAVGGIVGHVATEYDFDPEDDIEVSGTESFHIEQSVKAVVRESRNLGDVVGKKDYVGGIAGRADFGAVISCESYGNVSSTDGSYVGGIAGASGYCIRSCSYMGALSGKNYVGGIVGRGCDLFYNDAYPEIDYSGEYAGAIAGRLAEDGVLYGNYYVQEPLGKTGENGGKAVPGGIDSIGYANGAEPLSYEEFAAREKVPEAFRQFTVCFQADGRKVAAVLCQYGQAIEPAQIPPVPAKEGYYGEWPEFDYTYVTGNRILEARYEKWIPSLAGKEQGDEGRTKVLVQGKFRPEAGLVLEEAPEGTKISLQSFDSYEENEDGFQVRVLSRDTDTDKAVVEIWDGAGYTQVPAAVMGSYLEFHVNALSQGDSVLCVYRITEPLKDQAVSSVMITIAVAAALLLLAVLFFRHKKNRSKPAK